MEKQKKPRRRVERERPSAAKPAYMRVGHLCDRWQLSPATVYRMLEAGVVAHARHGRSILIAISEVERYEREHLGGAA